MSQTFLVNNNLSSNIIGYINKLEGRHNMDKPNDIYDEILQKDRDLALAAQLGQVLLDENASLKKENEKILEHFQQKIHEIEAEKSILKKKLEAAESDYEMQLQALQHDVMNLRKELGIQKSKAVVLEQNYEKRFEELTSNNEELTEELQGTKSENSGLHKKLNQLQERVISDRVALQEHVQQLEVLRSEILELRADKRKLEQAMNGVRTERDNLLAQLEREHGEQELREARERQDRQTIEMQQQEIQRLQQTAELIQNSIDCIQNRRQSANGQTTENKWSQRRPEELWLDMARLGNNDDSMVEMEDDESVLASLAADCGHDLTGSSVMIVPPDWLMNGTNQKTPTLAMETAGDESSCSSTGASQQFVMELRAEVSEVYCQLRMICADLSFRHQHRKGVNMDSACSTPDELAALEMDFKLGSLRSTLQELRGLLADLELAGSHGEEEGAAQQRMDALQNSLKEKMRELNLLNQEKELYDRKLVELQQCHQRMGEKTAGATAVNNLGTSSNNSSEDEANKEEEEWEVVKRNICNKRTEVERKMTRTRSEMEALVVARSSHGSNLMFSSIGATNTANNVDTDVQPREFVGGVWSWGKWPGVQEPNCDDDDIECD